MKFSGTYNDLKLIFKYSGLLGDWNVDGEKDIKSKKIFTTIDGNTINWWPTTNTILIQGKKHNIGKIEDKLKKSMSYFNKIDEVEEYIVESFSEENNVHTIKELKLRCVEIASKLKYQNKNIENIIDNAEIIYKYINS